MLADAMAAPAGVLQRSALVGIPLALVVLIFVTPGLLVRPGETQATDIPSLIARIMGNPWNDTVNESAVFYVRSALGLPLYENITFNVTGIDTQADMSKSCGGAGAWENATWTCGDSRVPSVWLKLPVVDEGAVNVTAMTEHGSTRFWYNATFEFEWAGPNLWVIRVTPEGDENSFDSATQFTTDMQREENP